MAAATSCHDNSSWQQSTPAGLSGSAFGGDFGQLGVREGSLVTVRVVINWLTSC